MSSRPEIYTDLRPDEIETFNSLTSCLREPLTAATLRRIFVVLMRVHYSHPNNFPGCYAHLRCMTWNKDPKLSTLTIEPLRKFDTNVVNQFPGIFIGNGDLSSTVPVIGGFGGMDEETWSTQYSVSLDVASIRIRHIGRNESDAYDMADMSKDFIQAMAVFIAPDMQASAIRVTGYSAAEKRDQPSDEFYAVDLSVSISYNHRVATILDGHRIGSLQIATQATPR